MGRSTHQSSVFIGLVVAASVTEPAQPEEIWYSIQVEDETGVVVYDQIVPKDYLRQKLVDLVPFPIGAEVLMGVSRAGATDRIFIAVGELADTGECQTGG